MTRFTASLAALCAAAATAVAQQPGLPLPGPQPIRFQTVERSVTGPLPGAPTVTLRVHRSGRATLSREGAATQRTLDAAELSEVARAVVALRAASLPGDVSAEVPAIFPGPPRFRLEVRAPGALGGSTAGRVGRVAAAHRPRLDPLLAALDRIEAGFTPSPGPLAFARIERSRAHAGSFSHLSVRASGRASLIEALGSAPREVDLSADRLRELSRAVHGLRAGTLPPDVSKGPLPPGAARFELEVEADPAALPILEGATRGVEGAIHPLFSARLDPVLEVLRRIELEILLTPPSQALLEGTVVLDAGEVLVEDWTGQRTRIGPPDVAQGLAAYAQLVVRLDGAPDPVSGAFAVTRVVSPQPQALEGVLVRSAIGGYALRVGAEEVVLEGPLQALYARVEGQRVVVEGQRFTSAAGPLPLLFGEALVGRTSRSTWAAVWRAGGSPRVTTLPRGRTVRAVGSSGPLVQARLDGGREGLVPEDAVEWTPTPSGGLVVPLLGGQ